MTAVRTAARVAPAPPAGPPAGSASSDAAPVRRRRRPVRAIVRFAGRRTLRTLVPHVVDHRTMTMLTGSVAPTIDPGDVVVSTPLDPTHVSGRAGPRAAAADVAGGLR